MSGQILGPLLGGIGLFLLGMRLMTEGLRIAAGPALRSILMRSTQTTMRGIGSGFLITAAVQSSSAVTVATIGFVNAGLLNLGQALAVTYGSNVGTTMTGWLVAVVGFHVDIKALALPLIGIGMALRIASRGGRIGPLGEALAGFGALFLGIDLLRVAFEGLSAEIQLAALVGEGALRALLFVAAGFALTVLMQSSSAAIALVLTATAGGVVPLGSGAALVIGANLGTTSTAVLAAIGATPAAKRVAAGHVAFNLITGAVAIALLPLLLFVLVRGRELLRLDAEPAAVLAGFHTLFNVLGVALLTPLTGRLIRTLGRHFQTAEEVEARPHFLDANVAASPDLAIVAMVLEQARLGEITRRLAREALRGAPYAPEHVSQGRESIASLVAAIGAYAQMLQRGRLLPEIGALLPTTFRVSRHYTEAAELAEMVARRPDSASPLPSPIAQELDAFVRSAEHLVSRAGIEIEGYDVERTADDLAEMQAGYEKLKSRLLDAGSTGAVAVHDLVSRLDWLSNVRRLAEQIERGTRALRQVEAASGANTGTRTAPPAA